MRMTREYVIDQLKLRAAAGIPVTKNNCMPDTGWPFGRSTVTRLFGSWNKAMAAAGLPVRSRGAPRKPHSCPACGALTINPKYCSTSCAARISNWIKPRRKKREHPCKHCGAAVTGRNSLCVPCHGANSIDTKTIAQVAMKMGKAAAKFAPIRARARQLHITPNAACERCGYSKHVEVCHIKAIADFDITTLVSDVNARTNITLLCPNCHWEQHNPS